MEEIAKCPLCGKVPNELFYNYQPENHVTCCDVQTPKSMWNQYAAAMTAERRLVELQEAVRWEREVEANIIFDTLHTTHVRLYDGGPLAKIIYARRSDIKMESRCARAAVDALVGGEK